MRGRIFWFAFTAMMIVALFAIACGDDDSGEEEQEAVCTQASDCGPREAWVCEEGACYLRGDFCRNNEECNGECGANHKCTEGKIQTSSNFCINVCYKIMQCSDTPQDWPNECIPACTEVADYVQNLTEVYECLPMDSCDIFTDAKSVLDYADGNCSTSYPEGYDPNGNGNGELCQFDCCSDEDCNAGFKCDLETHSCYYSPNCTEECCEDADCHNNPDFGPSYVCKFNKCIDPEATCPWECCEDEDCAPHEYCNMGACEEITIHCSPGERQCCLANESNPDCIKQGELASEFYLVCNAAGSGWTMEGCPSFNDCQTMPPDDIQCLPNGRCESDVDCNEPMVCMDGDEGKHCHLPELNAGDECWDGDKYVGDCPSGYYCCPISAGNPGYCVDEEC